MSSLGNVKNLTQEDTLRIIGREDPVITQTFVKLWLCSDHLCDLGHSV